ncbi:hypothetical protein E2562_013087 [Oryza meyeriana var. granulata]|uniref:Uncharacterized protein n=1 Tax=Oryza meyeriana var. granulata TaxID=110450 RepID=A0A6G1F7V1_9ORYZ|nr:hypothetical protein E2562_013087 [Oryza meyeriana var. granulata]
MYRKHMEARASRKPSHPATTSHTCYKYDIWGHWSCIYEEAQHAIDAYQAKRKAKAPAEAHLVVVDSIAGADAMASFSTSTPLDILTAAAIIAHMKVIQEQIFTEMNTFLDFV